MNSNLILPAKALPLAFALSFALAACSGSGEPAAPVQNGKAPSAQTAAAGQGAMPAGWQAIGGETVPSVAAGAATLPATVHSDDGVDVQVDDASRIVAGGDDIIAVIEALGQGSQVFAAPTNATTEAGRAAPHQFLFNRTTGVEGVLSLGGSLFLGNSLRRHSDLADKLRAVGQDAVIIDDLQPAPDKVRKVATAIGRAEAGAALADAVQKQLDEAAAIASATARKPRVIHVSATGAGGNPTVAGADSASGKLIALAGGLNIGTEAGVANFSALSNEGVVAAAPEVILVTEHDLHLFGGADGLWKAYPTLEQTPAGQAGRVWVMPDLQLKYTSVGSGAGALALARALAALPPA